MAIKFRDKWLELFYIDDKHHKKIPSAIKPALFRKLVILDAAINDCDLKAPPGNNFEYLSGNLLGKCSIRVNKQYRLIFIWKDGDALNTYLDPHRYRS